jgi:hypothetical protein
VSSAPAKTGQNYQLRAATGVEQTRSSPGQIGGSARGYQALFFVPLASQQSQLRTKWAVSQPYIYTSPRLR